MMHSTLGILTKQCVCWYETVEDSLPVLILYCCLSNSLAACHLIFGWHSTSTTVSHNGFISQTMSIQREKMIRANNIVNN